MNILWGQTRSLSSQRALSPIDPTCDPTCDPTSDKTVPTSRSRILGFLSVSVRSLQACLMPQVLF